MIATYIKPWLFLSASVDWCLILLITCDCSSLLLLRIRSPCPPMPETPPGCRSTAGRDRRSSTETGTPLSPSSSVAVSSYHLFFPPFRIHSLCFSLKTASKLQRLVTRCPPSAAMTSCTTGSKAWLSVCTGTYARGRSDWQTSPTPQTPKTDPAGAFSAAFWQRWRLFEDCMYWAYSD